MRPGMTGLWRIVRRAPLLYAGLAGMIAGGSAAFVEGIRIEHGAVGLYPDEMQAILFLDLFWGAGLGTLIAVLWSAFCKKPLSFPRFTCTFIWAWMLTHAAVYVRLSSYGGPDLLWGRFLLLIMLTLPLSILPLVSRSCQMWSVGLDGWAVAWFSAWLCAAELLLVSVGYPLLVLSTGVLDGKARWLGPAYAVAALPCLFLVFWSVLKIAGRGGRGLLGLFVAVVALCFCIEPAARGIRYLAARRAAEAPNLILISIDSLRADRAYCHGKMPALQRYASGGSLLTAANSQASWTLPSHASLLSSRYPAEHGAGRPQGSGLSPEVLTLAEILAQHSYETVAFTGGGWLSPYFGMDQGFAVFDTHGEMLLRPDYNPLSMLLFPNFERRADYWRIKVENWLKRRFARRTPFFLFLHTYQVHDYFKNAPYLAAHLKRAGARYDPHFLLPQLSTNSDENARGGDHILVAPPNQIAYLETLYDAAASYLDSELEGILKRLSHEDLSRKTLVILISDHGEGFKLEPRRLHHGGRLHQDLLHVPMLIRFDGVVPAGQKISTPVASLDLMPTALDLLGIPSPPDMRGVSLKDLIVVGTQPAQRLIFAEEVGYEITADYSRRELAANERQTALIADGIKFIRNLEGEELYDLKVDPDEVQNQLSSKPSLASRLRAATQEFQDRYPCCLTPAGPKGGLSPDLQRQLQSLGYL